MRSAAVSWVVAAIVVTATQVAGCNNERLPTAPEVSVEPFVVGNPPQFAGNQSPNYAGTWLGVVTHTGCRDVIAGRCRPLPDDSEAPLPVRLELSQGATSQLSGTLEYGERGRYFFSGFISSALGIAGIAAPAAQTVVVRFERTGAGTAFGGFLITETRENSGRLIQTQKYDVTDPLRRSVP